MKHGCTGKVIRRRYVALMQDISLGWLEYALPLAKCLMSLFHVPPAPA